MRLIQKHSSIALVEVFTVVGLFAMTSNSLAQGDTWSKKANMSRPRSLLSTSAVNGKIYAIGGLGGSSAVEEYDPATDTWTTKTRMPTGRQWVSTSAVNGKIYAIGGDATTGAPGLATVEEYDPATDTWTQKADMPTARFALSTSVVDGKIYAIADLSALGVGILRSWKRTTRRPIPGQRKRICQRQGLRFPPASWMERFMPSAEHSVPGGPVFRWWRCTTQGRIPGQEQPLCQHEERLSYPPAR